MVYKMSKRLWKFLVTLSNKELISLKKKVYFSLVSNSTQKRTFGVIRYRGNWKGMEEKNFYPSGDGEQTCL